MAPRSRSGLRTCGQPGDPATAVGQALSTDMISVVCVPHNPHSSPTDLQSYELCSDMIDVVIDVSCIYGSGEGESPAYDARSSSVIKLNNGLVLYLREVTRYLALVCLLREENFKKHGLIDYNFHCFRTAIQEVCLPSISCLVLSAPLPSFFFFFFED